MQKIVLISVLCILAGLSNIANATISWEGLEWTANPGDTDVAVNTTTGNLELVAGPTYGGGWAQYPWPGQNPGFTTDYFKISFDLDATVDGVANATMVQIANYAGTDKAQILVHLQDQVVKYDDNSDNSYVSESITALPTTGQHSLTFERDSVSGLVSITLDDSTLIWQATTGLKMDGIDYVRAGVGRFPEGGGGSAVYTGMVIPEPTTLALVGLGSFMFRRKRR